MSEQLVDHRRSGLERHVQTIVGGLVLAGVVWMSSTLTAQNAQLARVDERVASIERQLDELRGDARNRYTRDDAARDFDVRDNKLADILGRVQRLEGRVLMPERPQ